MRTELYRPDPPPAGLASECTAGPDYPEGDALLGDVIEVVQAREKAAAECRAKHAALAGWALDVSGSRRSSDGGRLDH